MKYLTAISILLLSHGLYAGGHDDSEPSFEGLISSEIFDLDGKMDMHVERRESCGGDTPKHFHPALEHWFMFLMESRNPSLRVSGRNTQKTSTGLKELTGCMEEIQIHPL